MHTLASKYPRFAPNPLALLVRQCFGAGLALAAASVVAQTAPASQTLQQVIVTDQAEAIGGLQKTYSGGQFARGGSLGLLGNIDLMNIPFSTTNYTSELIKNQQALSVADVVMNDASVRTLTSRGGFGDDFQIRGFQVGNGDIAMNGLLGLAPTTRIPLEMIERVEVLKGPGALANGVGPNGSIGGSINVVTKRASDIPLTQLTTTYMGKSQFGAQLDVGRRFGEDNKWGVRVNGLVRGGEGNIDGGKQNLSLGSLGLDYAGARTRFSLDALATGGETKEFRPQTSFAGPGVPAAPSARLNFYPGTKLEDNVKTLMSRLEHDLNDSTTVYGSVGYTALDYQQIFPSGRPNTAGNFNVSNAYYDQETDSASADIGLRTRFSTGSVRHTLALGANHLNQETAYFYATSPTSNPSSLYNPSQLPVITALRGNPGKSAVVKQSSFAVADTMAFMDDSFLLTLGLRDQTLAQDNFNPATGAGTGSYKSSAVTPLAGLVFKPQKNISVYTNYTSGLTRGGTAGVTTANAGQTFAPQKSEQNEVGVKVDWGKLTTQAALYQIKRPNAMTDPLTNVYSFGGEQTNRGLELTAYGEVQRGLRLMASAAFNDAKLTRTAGGVNQGNDAAGVPKSTFNLGLDWDTPWAQGLSLNGRVINTSSVYADAANRMEVDGWTRLDIGARYATRLSGKPLTLRANLENVTGKDYWVVSNYVTVGAPRTLMLSATVDF
ncbi:TonB-dependent siderophore receptor [uncultured Ramlibacter sp.]|uniref:TonB-dependent receptor n=1 Tax=uncultured Ramlibacter sp. TaxID=260755 RepID=UPI00261E37DF|nr:TonB-dependent siderophore receptor [uncultured Ramlibacter sp.]